MNHQPNTPILPYPLTMDPLPSFKSISSNFCTRRKVFHSAWQVISLGLMVGQALMIWKTLQVVSGCEGPLVAVLSGSMEPAFYRGDVLAVYLDDSPFEIGEIIVFKVPGKDIPIVHRIIKIHQKDNGDVELLTKGDANPVDDAAGMIYDYGQHYLTRKDVVGRPVGYLPYIGWVTIWVNEIPYFKQVIFGIIVVLTLINRE